jgi:hypothetical protein
MEKSHNTELTSEQWRIINYLNFKMTCVADQEALGIRLDYNKAVKHRDELLLAQEEKVVQLTAAMPKVPIISKKKKPDTTHKKDGTFNVYGAAWFKLLKDNKLPVTFNDELEVVTGYKEANPASSHQVKAWLDSLGWKPATFNFVREDDGSERKVPQVRNDGELCDSVKRLIKKDAGVAVLDGLTIINHRLSVFQGFIDSAYQREGEWYLTAGVGGLTNTLRFRHRKPIANLPKVNVPWGAEIRGCLIAGDGQVLCGSDLVSLESTTKRHYMYPHDPDYVEAMSVPGFDEHLDLATFAGAVTREQVEQHKNKEIDLSDIRQNYKQTNYSAVYGIGPPKLARALDTSVGQAKALLEAYWDRNWAVKEIAKEQCVRTIGDQLWLYNPVSGFWISLRYEKDIFSSLNQSTGVYVFDKWLALCKKLGLQVIMQYHDEHLSLVTPGDEQQHENKIKEAIDILNKDIKLNVPIDADSKFGFTYASVH